MNIERDHGALVVQFEKGRSSAAWRSARRTLKYPPLLDQIFDDQRNGAALQTRDASQIRLKTRFRLIWRGVLFDALCLRVNVNRDEGEVGMVSLSVLQKINAID
jgi:hypothetical protein